VFLDPLPAASHRLHVLIAAVGAGTRHACLIAAMMALKVIAPSRAAMQHRIRGATRALADPAARGAIEHRSIAAPVQEYQRLLPALQPLAQRLDQMRREPLLHGKAA